MAKFRKFKRKFKKFKKKFKKFKRKTKNKNFKKKVKKVVFSLAETKRITTRDGLE